MENEELKIPKLYSYLGICLATFLGGPLAGGIVIYKNLQVLEKRRKGLTIVISFFIFQTLLFCSIIFIPKYFVNQIPNFLIPFITALIVYHTSKKLFGEELKFREINHIKSKNNLKAVGIGLLVLLISSSVFLSFAIPMRLLSEPEEFEEFKSEFALNEAKTSDFNEHFFNLSDSELASYFQKDYLPIWYENKELIQEIKESDVYLNWDMEKKLELLEEYTDKRILIGEVFLKDYKNRHATYIEDINLIIGDIQDILRELEELS
ncbi:hypothetical protein [Algoriphagus algorifonticola]|uniref:hypothetical protein n=1 Tax=Algoriphagus algorifonticola TaxID=2593007 RepID=UPI0011A83C03|nr:hypothetical protein [Algoriphagus algorifonticola]